MRASGDRTNAGERLPILLRLQGLRGTPQAEAGGLLRLLLLRLGAVPADSSGAVRRLCDHSPFVLALIGTVCCGALSRCWHKKTVRCGAPIWSLLEYSGHAASVAGPGRLLRFRADCTPLPWP